MTSHVNNPKFGEYVDVIYPSEFRIKDTTDPQVLLHI